MKILKFAGIAGAALLLLLVVATTVIAVKFDANWAKQEAMRVVKEEKQRDLRIDGELSLSFFPALGIRLGKASLSEVRSGDEFVGVESARVSVRLIPLLAKQIVVDRIELQGVRANLIRRKDGGFNFDDLLSKRQGESPLRFDLASLSIGSTTLGYRDEATGRQIRLDDVKLKTGPLANAAHGDLRLSGRFDDRQSATEAHFDLVAAYDFEAERQHFVFSDLKAKLTGDAAGMKNLDARLAVRVLALAGANNDMRVEGASFESKAQLAGEVLEARLDLPQWLLVGDKLSSEATRGSFALAGKSRRLEGKLELSALEGSPAALRAGKLGVRWTLQQGATQVRGELVSPLQGNLGIFLFDLPRLAGEAEISHPSMPMKQLKLPLSGALQAELGKSGISGNLATHFDETNIQATWKAARLAPLSLVFELLVDQLNVDRYLPPDAPMETAKSGSDVPPSSPDSLADHVAGKGPGIQGVVRIGALQMHTIKINNIRADLRVINGRLDIGPLNALIHQGALSGATK